MVLPLPPIQYALLHSVVAASLLFVLLKIIKEMGVTAKHRPRFILITVGKSPLWGIFYLTATWVLTSFYIFLFIAWCQEPNVFVEKFLWTLGFIGCFYASVSIFKLLINGNFDSYLLY